MNKAFLAVVAATLSTVPACTDIEELEPWELCDTDCEDATDGTEPRMYTSSSSSSSSSTTTGGQEHTFSCCPSHSPPVPFVAAKAWTSCYTNSCSVQYARPGYSTSCSSYSDDKPCRKSGPAQF